ncbi:MAG: methyltransferase [Pseudomonadota bacterium]
MIETTENAFLNGRLRIRQPKSGYRAGADPVLLAAAVDAVPGQRVLELGAGVGTALMCLGSRVSGLSLTGVEVQGNLAEIARENCRLNALEADIYEANIAELPSEVLQQRYDHVMTNPPFFDRDSGSAASDAGRETGRGQSLDLSTWLEIAIRRVAPGGKVTLINRIERFPECLCALLPKVGDIAVLPLAPRVGRAAKLFLLSAKKGSNGPFCFLPAFILHEGLRHDEDRDSYTDAAQAVLRDGQGLTLKS